MELVELWMMIQIRHKVKYYNGQRLTQLLTKFTQTTDTIDSLTTNSGIKTAYQGRKSTELQSNALSIEHIKNLDEALEDSEKGPAANHVQNIKC